MEKDNKLTHTQKYKCLVDALDIIREDKEIEVLKPEPDATAIEYLQRTIDGLVQIVEEYKDNK